MNCEYLFFFLYIIFALIFTRYLISIILLPRYINCPILEFRKKKIIDFPRLNPGINPKQPLHLVDRRIIKSRSTGIVQLSNLGRDRRPCL